MGDAVAVQLHVDHVGRCDVGHHLDERFVRNLATTQTQRGFALRGLLKHAFKLHMLLQVQLESVIRGSALNHLG